MYVSDIWHGNRSGNTAYSLDPSRLQRFPPVEGTDEGVSKKTSGAFAGGEGGFRRQRAIPVRLGESLPSPFDARKDGEAWPKWGSVDEKARSQL